jgi:DHA2 family methylenomycin A resistance protein-like MFS transporter
MKPVERLPPALRRLVAATSFGFVVVQLDVTIVNVALPRIGAELGTGTDGLQWVVDAYTLAFAVFLLSAGVIGDRFGSKRAYLTGFWLFATASLACGLAGSGGFLVAARAVQGVGAALLVPNSLALLNHATAHSPPLRAHAVGLWTAASAAAIACGPLTGAILLGLFGWRSIFFANLPLCLLGLLLTRRAVPEKDRPEADHPLDWAGQALAVLVLTALTGAVIELRPLGLAHPVVLGGFAAALLGGAAFLAVESRVREPMLPLGFFRRPNFSAATVFGTLLNLTYYGVLFVLSLYLQQAHGYSPIRTGLAYLPLTATFVVSNLLSARLAARRGPRLTMITGALIGAAGFALLSRLDAGSSFGSMLPAFVLIPGGMGLAVPAMTTAILSTVERGRSGTASAVLNTARQAGGAIGVALFGALAAGAAPRIVGGLRASAVISTTLLLLGAGLARAFLRDPDHIRPERFAEGPLE